MFLATLSAKRGADEEESMRNFPQNKLGNESRYALARSHANLCLVFGTNSSMRYDRDVIYDVATDTEGLNVFFCG